MFTRKIFASDITLISNLSPVSSIKEVIDDMNSRFELANIPEPIHKYMRILYSCMLNWFMNAYHTSFVVGLLVPSLRRILSEVSNAGRSSVTEYASVIEDDVTFAKLSGLRKLCLLFNETLLPKINADIMESLGLTFVIQNNTPINVTFNVLKLDLLLTEIISIFLCKYLAVAGHLDVIDATLSFCREARLDRSIGNSSPYVSLNRLQYIRSSYAFANKDFNVNLPDDLFLAKGPNQFSYESACWLFARIGVQEVAFNGCWDIFSLMPMGFHLMSLFFLYSYNVQRNVALAFSDVDQVKTKYKGIDYIPLALAKHWAMLTPQLALLSGPHWSSFSFSRSPGNQSRVIFDTTENLRANLLPNLSGMNLSQVRDWFYFDKTNVHSDPASAFIELLSTDPFRVILPIGSVEIPPIVNIFKSCRDQALDYLASYHRITDEISATGLNKAAFFINFNSNFYGY